MGFINWLLGGQSKKQTTTKSPTDLKEMEKRILNQVEPHVLPPRTQTPPATKIPLRRADTTEKARTVLQNWLKEDE